MSRMKFNNVNTPIAVVGIFASLAEIAGVSVLPLISPDLQKIFIWYVMLFPLVLLICFFITWNFNAKVLYPPSEFRDEKNYLNQFKILSNEEELKHQVQSLDEIKKQLIEVMEKVPEFSRGSDSIENSVDANGSFVLKSNETSRKATEIEEKLKDVVQNVEEVQKYQKVAYSTLRKHNVILRKLAIEKSKGECNICKKRYGDKLEMHHIIPLSKGGENILDNVTVLCSDCHRNLHENEEMLAL